MNILKEMDNKQIDVKYIKLLTQTMYICDMLMQQMDYKTFEK